AVNDLESGKQEVGRTQHVGNSQIRPDESFLQHEGDLDLHPRGTQLLRRDSGGLWHEHVGEQMPIVRLGHPELLLHDTRSEADLMTLERRRAFQASDDPEALDVISVGYIKSRVGLAERFYGLAIALGLGQGHCSLGALGLGEHLFPPARLWMIG